MVIATPVSFLTTPPAEVFSIDTHSQKANTSTLTGDSDSIDQPVASLSGGEFGANNIRINHGQGVSASERYGRVGGGNSHSGGGADLCMC